jgi:hypothetical protein
MTRPFAAVVDRAAAAIARLTAVPAFLDGARQSMGAPVLGEWRLKCLRECDGAAHLLRDGIPRWIALEGIGESQANHLTRAAEQAGAAFEEFRQWLEGGGGPNDRHACGPDLFDLLLTRGHWCDRPRTTLAAEARQALTRALEQPALARSSNRARRMARDQRRLTSAIRRSMTICPLSTRWDACRERADAFDLMTWPAYPIRYVPIPAHARRRAVPVLPPPPIARALHRLPVHDYVVTPIEPDMPADEQRSRCARPTPA